MSTHILAPASLSVGKVEYSDLKKVLAEAHYIGKPGSTAIALGLWQSGELAGVLTFGTVPANNARAICGQDYAASVLELTRLALYDWAPPNSESWFIGQAFAWLRGDRPDVHILLSYADASVGHVGTIYQATNWIYTGRTTGDVYWQCDDGRKLHPRTVGFRDTVKPPGRFMPSPAKHRYVMLLGSRGQRRKLQSLMRWPGLPYPKAGLA